ncbi:MAG TPA: universal stress protein, partial [Phormidium sp.]
MIEKILLADSGTGHTEEMLKALMEIPSIKPASVTVLHVVPPQVNADEMTAKWEQGGKFLATAIQTLGLDPNNV